MAPPLRRPHLLPIAALYNGFSVFQSPSCMRLSQAGEEGCLDTVPLTNSAFLLEIRLQPFPLLPPFPRTTVGCGSWVWVPWGLSGEKKGKRERRWSIRDVSVPPSPKRKSRVHGWQTGKARILLCPCWRPAWSCSDSMQEDLTPWLSQGATQKCVSYSKIDKV